MKVLILHAYSAENKGDGLLVEETLNMVRRAFGSNIEVAVVASYPDSFTHLGCRMYNSRPSRKGFSAEYVRLIFNRAKEYDVIVSVGGGYLRGKSITEILKASLIHGPQLLLGASRGKNSVYLPQSIGPFSRPVAAAIRRLLGHVAAVWLRDDRSVVQLRLANANRAPDLAILGMLRRDVPFDVSKRVIMTVRHVHGQLPLPLRKLRGLTGPVDSYVQSNVSSNSDVLAVQELLPLEVLEYSELMVNNTESRVIVAVRLHAALMALAAGHYVIHLAYERKGFGAFQDLGLDEYVHNVNDFDPNLVMNSVKDLRDNASIRDDYDRRLARSLRKAQTSTALVVDSMRAAAGVQQR